MLSCPVAQNVYFSFIWDVSWIMINKTSETDIGVQPEDQKSKAASHWLLPRLQSENGDPASWKLKKRALSCFVILSSSGIKGVHQYHLVSMAS